MFDQFPALQQGYLGNTLQAYLTSLIFFVAAVFGLIVIEKIILSNLKKLTEKTATHLDDVVFGILDKMIVPLLYVGAFYFALKQLVLPEAIDKVVTGFTVIVLIVQLSRMAIAIISRLFEYIWSRSESGQTGLGVTKSVMTIVRVVVWGIAAVFALDNLGFNVSAVVAGLGIGGVAVALAAQNILGDLFNYFVIFFDKPFEDGDFIILGEYLGVIEHVGIKSTRIRSLGGEQIVISNSDLTSSRLRNYKRMERRRVLFKLGVIYQTSLEKIKRIPVIVKEVVASVENTAFDRAHFASFGDFSLNLEIVYYVLSGDYNLYMSVQQDINFRIKEAFEKEGIEFAYPTQLVYMDKVQS
ncbi:MAG: mechanosensitive ion channel family protein [Candidatus Omnitrophota bacterium]|nr:mechanosensitive ion channel family protein [Candidatus Omnitrophota bacterium]